MKIVLSEFGPNLFVHESSLRATWNLSAVLGQILARSSVSDGDEANQRMRREKSFRKLKVGDPFDDQTKLGPVVSREHKEKIERYIALARDNGYEVIASGDLDEKTSVAKKGYYIRPTVVLNLDDQSKLMTDEIFGPVVCIVPFDNEDEVKPFLSSCLPNL